MEIDLNSELTFRNSFLFPIQNVFARKEVLWGAMLVLVPVLGWVLNMGHRIEMVHKMHHGQPAWPCWNNYRRLLKSGTIAFLGMIYYYLPGAILATLTFHWRLAWLEALATGLLLLATVYTGLHDSLLSRLRYARNLRSHSSLRPDHSRWSRLLEGVGDYGLSARVIVSRITRAGNRLSRHQCLVLAGGGIQLCSSVYPSVCLV